MDTEMLIYTCELEYTFFAELHFFICFTYVHFQVWNDCEVYQFKSYTQQLVYINFKKFRTFLFSDKTVSKN